MPKIVAVIAAHPDDEILGCGGAMASHIKNGDEVHVLIMAEGITSRGVERDRGKDEKELSALTKIAHEANKVLGVSSLRLDQLPDNRLDSLDRLDLVKHVEAFIQLYKPSIIYTHHAGDVNIDHRCVHEAVVTAVRPMPKQHRVSTILFFEVASSTEWQTPGSAPAFSPNWYVDISETLPLKLQALEVYQSEMRDWPHARSIKALEHLARWRGANVGVSAAEAFMLGRRCV